MSVFGPFRQNPLPKLDPNRIEHVKYDFAFDDRGSLYPHIEAFLRRRSGDGRKEQWGGKKVSPEYPLKGSFVDPEKRPFILPSLPPGMRCDIYPGDWIQDVDAGMAVAPAIQQGLKRTESQSYTCEPGFSHRVERLHGVHAPTQCAGQVACPVHRKTNHPYRNWQQTWVDVTRPPGVRRFMRRVCQHGHWVVDPDEPFKPPFPGQLGASDCASCNLEYAGRLHESAKEIAVNLGKVREFLERGDYGKTIRLTEALPEGGEVTYEFLPDEAEIYLAFCEREVELELSPGSGRPAPIPDFGIDDPKFWYWEGEGEDDE